MSLVFTPAPLGSLELPNRLVHSATYECMASDDGLVNDQLLTRYRTLAQGEVGLIIPGHMYVHPRGQAYFRQIAIDRDQTLPGLARLCQAVHEHGGRIAFQLAHAGRQAPRVVIGQAPLAPSGKGRDPASLNKPQAISPEQIEEVVQSFAAAARRARQAGADAIQIHGAHGYLISEFLSPFYNRRRDQWGGSAEGRFRLLAQVFDAVREAVGPEMPVLVKLNANDFTPRPGTTPELAKQYAGWLAELGLDGLEVSGGTYYSLHSVRGDIPLKEMTRPLPAWMRLPAKFSFGRQRGPCRFEPLFNLAGAQVIKPALGQVPLLLVGGVRRLQEMEQVLASSQAEFLSMSRPFIREPFLVKRLRTGKTSQAACISCNKCFAAVFNRLPLRCYVNGLGLD